ncbi:MAG: SpoIID/LytB domain-containing protein [Muribaculaceae bacterium]
MEQPKVTVGIMSATSIKVRLLDTYRSADGAAVPPQTLLFSITNDKRIAWQDGTHDEVMLTPATSDATFEIFDVTIGVNFHWERRENQRFSGALRVIVEGDKLTIINILPVEDYLLSVISSEMSATASPELLKAHAVISRSWLLAQIRKNKKIALSGEAYSAMTVNDDEIVRWYDREDHINFDVCADDHCQRYQGVTRQSTPTVAEAIRATFGEVLIDHDGELCDARFSKCCGGVYEEFENCWEPRHYHYLEARRDAPAETDFPDLSIEDNARRWIMQRPEAFCNTDDAAILSQVLNNYDQETTDFYRWSVTYGREELARLVKERTGIDFGYIKDLQPIERGTSGRLVKLRIIGTRRSMTIGKELEIRRSLSPSHLYSSAFIVERQGVDADGVPEHITLHGAGWGHGVGLCQIGAAVMGAKGYDYKAILRHYFIGADLRRLY